MKSNASSPPIGGDHQRVMILSRLGRSSEVFRALNKSSCLKNGPTYDIDLSIVFFVLHCFSKLNYGCQSNGGIVQYFISSVDRRRSGTLLSAIRNEVSSFLSVMTVYANLPRICPVPLKCVKLNWAASTIATRRHSGHRKGKRNVSFNIRANICTVCRNFQNCKFAQTNKFILIIIRI